MKKTRETESKGTGETELNSTRMAGSKSTNYLLDSFAIIELLEGSEAGKKVRKVIEENESHIFISALSVYEVGTVVERDQGRNKMVEVVRSLSTYFQVVDVTVDVSLHAIDLKRSFKLPTVDCLIYSSAKETGAVVVSGCKHFCGISGEKDVLIIRG